MITHFDSSFAGHIMDNVGYRGPPVNDRLFSNEELITVYDKGEAIAKTLDRLRLQHYADAEEVMPTFTHLVTATVAGD